MHSTGFYPYSILYFVHGSASLSIYLLRCGRFRSERKKIWCWRGITLVDCHHLDADRRIKSTIHAKEKGYCDSTCISLSISPSLLKFIICPLFATYILLIPLRRMAGSSTPHYWCAQLRLIYHSFLVLHYHGDIVWEYVYHVGGLHHIAWVESNRKS